MEIPFERLSPEILQRVVEDFVLREGTDYGPTEFSLEQKVATVMKQLQRGLVKVVFDEKDETCTLVPTSRGTT